MSTSLAKISLKEKITELTRAIGNIEKSFDSLANKESGYAKEHLILIESYGDALKSFEIGLNKCDYLDSP